MPFLKMTWEPKPNTLPALSIRQPFAEAILAGTKTSELREWATSYRGPIVLHAGKTWYAQEDYGEDYAKLIALHTARVMGISDDMDAYPLGALVGIAILTDCERLTSERWEQTKEQHQKQGMWDCTDTAWFLEDVHRFSTPISYRGYPGLFGVSEEMIIESFPFIDEYLGKHLTIK